MKVILRDRVENLGKFGDVVKVAEGYARNYLFPRKLALEATDANQRQFEAQREAYLRKELVRKEKAEDVKAEIEAVVLNFSRKAAEDERLFGSVTSHDVEEALKQRGIHRERKDIVLHEPIKRLGIHTVEVKLHPEVTANLKIDVVKEL